MIHLGRLCCLLLFFSTPVLAGNVILFIGDGTGLAQISAARIAAAGPDGHLAIDQLEHIAIMTTHSADALTTDSAAGATAWSAGVKTNNKYLAVDAQNHPVRTVLEYARDAGMGTGLVTTTSLTHATPAAFAAHINDRGAEPEIAVQMLQSRVNLLMGGGRKHWAEREDGRDLLQEARSAGYTVVENAAALSNVRLKDTRYMLGLFAEAHLPYVYDQQDGEVPALEEMTASALTMLGHSKKGFFLMVEGGRIDHGSHGNDATRAIWEMIAFDRAIAQGLAFAAKREDTLVLFVADHETGGMSVANEYYAGFPTIPQEDGFPARDLDLGTELKIGWASGGHSGIPVLAMAKGPGAERVRGLIDNTDIFSFLMKGLGLKVKK